MKAKNFHLQDQNGNTHSLETYAGKWLVLYFYPKDDTPGCTKEACNFISFPHASVVGISKDSVKSHAKFAQKYHLNFPILSDETLETIKAYGAWGKKKLYGREYDGVLRNTYLINPKGEIVKTYLGVKPDTHAAEILKDLKALQ